MLRHVMIGLAAATLVGAAFIPADAAAQDPASGGGRTSGSAQADPAGGKARTTGSRTRAARPSARKSASRAVVMHRNLFRGWGVASVGPAAAGYYGSNYSYRYGYWY